MKRCLFFIFLSFAGIPSCIMDDGTILDYGEFYTPTSITIDGIEYSCKKSSAIFRGDEWHDKSDRFKFWFLRELYDTNRDEIVLYLDFFIARPLVCNQRYNLTEHTAENTEVCFWKQNVSYHITEGWIQFDDIRFTESSGFAHDYDDPAIDLSFEFTASDGVDTIFVKNGYTRAEPDRNLYPKYYHKIYNTPYYEIITDGEYHDFWPQNLNNPWN